MAKIKCPRCFYVNPDGRDSCVKCSTALPKIKIEAMAPASATPAGYAESQLRRGQMLAGRYTVLNLVGRGGMGCIYKVHDNILSEDVALKTLLPQFVQDKMVVDRFFNEARIARRLAHAHIVRVHDIGSAEGVVYISMEFLQGKSLRGVLESLPPGQRLPLKQTLRIIDQLCAALEYAHQYTIHRDIKPENVMIMADGAVKLMDFGISKLMDNTRLTGASIIMGTPFYMSPEQVRNSRDVDARSDLYSVGVMLYEIVTGNVPTGVPRAASQMMKDVPPQLDAIIAKCVDPDPAGRFQSASELRAALRPLIDMLGGVLPPAGEFTRHERVAPSRHWPARSLLGLLLAASLLLLVGVGLFGLEQQRQNLLAHAANRPAAEATPANTGDSVARYARLESLITQARARAQTKMKRSDTAQALFDTGEKLWASAQTARASNTDDALLDAKEALENYLGAALWREGMVFVPSGAVKIAGHDEKTAAFLMDETEVTVERYNAFCNSVAGGWPAPPGLKDIAKSNPKLPVTQVSFFDAQAFAAWEDKLLPTQEEWARAAYGGESSDQFPPNGPWEEDTANVLGATDHEAAVPVKSFEKDITWSKCRDMAGNVAEWTRTPAEEYRDKTPDFGVPMVVMGGHFRAAPAPLGAVSAHPYEARNADYVGFRCVQEIPTEPAAIEALLARM
jgi:formylglycine-generating enzyme required for sulfatase activity